MSDNAGYTMPNLETNPANVALWAQASFFFYMCVSSVFDLDMMELSSDPDYIFTAVTGVTVSYTHLTLPTNYSE